MVSQGSLHAESESQNRTLEAHGEQDVLQLSRTSFAARAEARALQNPQIAIYVRLCSARGKATFWTCLNKVSESNLGHCCIRQHKPTKVATLLRICPLGSGSPEGQPQQKACLSQPLCKVWLPVQSFMPYSGKKKNLSLRQKCWDWKPEILLFHLLSKSQDVTVILFGIFWLCVLPLKIWVSLFSSAPLPDVMVARRSLLFVGAFLGWRDWASRCLRR